MTVDVREADTQTVFTQIKEQTGLNFVYNADQLRSMPRITLRMENATVEAVLEQMFKGTAFEFRFEEGIVIVKRKVQEVKESVTITGLVTDKDNIPLPGVTVQVGGTSAGTATNEKGRFSITLPMTKGKLRFSFVGYKSQEVEFSATRDTLHITLEEEATNIDEVVVTGYGNITKSNYTGAATTVKAEDVLMAGVSSIDQMLQGVVPGMLVWNTTGQVGATPKVRVRGTSTLLGSQEPVWVVDGVIQRDPQPFNSEENTKFSVDADDIRELAGNAISWLNPRDIETITVLKDASATAIYGSKAANGVIAITTKKAKAGRTQVSYNGTFSIGQRPRYGLYDLMNSEEHMEFQREIHEERKKYPSSAYILPMGYYGLQQQLLRKEITLEEANREYEHMARMNTDWFDILFRNSFNQSHYLGVSGGSEKIQSRLSLGFTQENGEAKGNDVTNFTVSSGTTAQLWDRLTLNFSLNGSIRHVKGFAYGVDPFTYAYTTSRGMPAYNEDGSLYYHVKSGNSSTAISGKSTYDYNILNELANTGSENTTRTWSASLDLQLNIVSGLEYQGLFSYSSSSSDTKKYAGERSFYISARRGYEYGSVLPYSDEAKSTPLPMGGVLETDLTNTTSISVRNSLVYNQLFKENHRITLQLGVETNSVKSKGESNLRWGYMPDRGESFATPPETYLYYGTETSNRDYVSGSHTVVNRTENSFSGFGTAVYTYADRYVLNFSARVDASNRFGQDKNKRFQPTWSAGLKWRVADEPFLNTSWWFNNLDIYVSYGYQGNAVTNVSPELIAREEYLNHFSAYGLAIVSLPYPDLGWEKTKTWNLGVDASFLQGRLNFTFNYYQKTSEVLSSKDVPRENGVESGIVSGTTMKNNGYDFAINVIPIRTNNFSWQLSLNTSVTNNSVEKNNRENTLDDYLDGSAVVDGRPFSTFWSYEFAGLNPETGLPTFANMDIALENAETPKDFLIETGKFTPNFTGGLNTQFQYKHWSLYALFAVQWGGHDRLPDLYPASSTVGSGLPLPDQNVSRKLKDRWRQPGDDTQIPTLPSAGQEENVILPQTQTTLYSSTKNCYEMYNMSDVRVANTDFIRCRSLSLSYDFEGKWMQKVGIGYLQLQASMTNPFMWVSDKKWDGLDPETGDWPARRVTSLSLQLMF